MNKNDVVKIVTSYLYDYVIETVINLLKQHVNISHPKYISDYIETFDKYKRLFPDIYNIQHQNDINELEYLIYYIKSIQIDDTYDYNEDIFYGLHSFQNHLDKWRVVYRLKKICFVIKKRQK